MQLQVTHLVVIVRCVLCIQQRSSQYSQWRSSGCGDVYKLNRFTWQGSEADKQRERPVFTEIFSTEVKPGHCQRVHCTCR